MTYTAFAKQYEGKVLEDNGSVLSKDFKKFAKSFQSMLKDEAATDGWEINTYNVGHYYVSGYLHKDGRYLYFSYAPARLMPLNLVSARALHSVLIRSARDTKDYVGGRNHFCAVKDIASLIHRLDSTRYIW